MPGAAPDNSRASLHGHWSSRLAFILAVTGSAVGLGNVWKFPYMVGQNGGGAFVLVYLLAVLLIGLPIMMAEILIGRRGRRNPVTTMAILGVEESGTAAWRWIGIMGIVGGMLILSFYSAIAGWTMAYIVKSATGTFTGATSETVNAEFVALIADPLTMGAWHTLFMALTVIVVARGVERGLESAVRVMVPALFFILVLLLFYAASTGEFLTALRFMFAPDFSRLTPGVVLAAVGQAFFSLSVGMGCIMAYGAYLPQDASIAQTSVAVVLSDTAIALLAGLVVFPVVFAFGLDPAEGPGLVFQTLPLALGQLTGGALFGMLFFLLLAFAALTSAISLIEGVVAWLIETRGLSRPVAATAAGVTIWLIGFLTVLSFNVLKDFRFGRGTIFDNVDFLTSNVMLPLGGLLIVVFAGWFMSPNSTAAELDPAGGRLYRTWHGLAKFLAPVAILLVFLNSVGAFG